MSKIVSPFPPADASVVPRSAASQWWRLRLVDRNADGELMVCRTDAHGDDWTSATWVEWEFFDGHNSILDTGLDRPTLARTSRRGPTYYIDVLHVGPPTPSSRWRPLTIPGDWMHPDDRDADAVETLQG